MRMFGLQVGHSFSPCSFYLIQSIILLLAWEVVSEHTEAFFCGSQLNIQVRLGTYGISSILNGVG